MTTMRNRVTLHKLTDHDPRRNGAFVLAAWYPEADLAGDYLLPEGYAVSAAGLEISSQEAAAHLCTVGNKPAIKLHTGQTLFLEAA